MRSGPHSLVGVALHQAQFLQAVGHHAAHFHVHIPPLHIGCCHLQDVVVTGFHYAVYLALALCEASADGCGARVVAAVVLVGLRSCVAEHQPACLQSSGAGVAVHYFAVHCNDGGERNHAAASAGYAAYHTGNILLGHSGSAQTHGCGVHVVAYGTCPLYLLYLALALHRTQVDDSHDEVE